VLLALAEPAPFADPDPLALSERALPDIAPARSPDAAPLAEPAVSRTRFTAEPA